MLEILDKQIAARVEQTLAAHPDWPCRRGCDHCCRSLAHSPRITSSEWQRVKAALDCLPAAVAEPAKRRISASNEGTRTCPLLEQSSGECLIYSSRPTACRTYGFYADREGGQYCEAIDKRVQCGEFAEVIWGNQEVIDARLEGNRRTLAEWFADTLS